jgi:hypothetical protein
VRLHTRRGFPGAVTARYRLRVSEDRERVLDRALALQQAEAREAERRAAEARDRKVAAELGVDGATLDRAARVVAAEDAARALRRRRAGVGSAIAVALAAATWAAWPTPPAPLVDELTETPWALAADGRSRATLTRTADGALRVDVEAFVPGEDGKYHVNVDRHDALPSLAEYARVELRVRGEGLGVVRLFLEGGDRRWRTPPIAVRSSWSSVVIPLDALEQLRRVDGAWQAEGRGRPDGATSWSLKLGHFMNPPDAHGFVELDRLRFE